MCGARCDLFTLLTQDAERSWHFKLHLHLLQSQHYSNKKIEYAASLERVPPKVDSSVSTEVLSCPGRLEG